MFFQHFDPHADLGQEQHDFEKDNSGNFVVIIMAGGEGKRMNSSLPKVLTPIHKKPMLIRILNTLNTLEPTPHKILIVVGKHHDLIKHIVLKEFKHSKNIHFIHQKEPLGTGDAVKCCLPELEWNDNVLILNGDVPFIQNETILDFVNGCDEAGIISLNMDNPKGYGRIIYKQSGRKKEFKAIREEKDCSEDERLIQEVNAGIYFFNAMVLRTYIPKIDNHNKANEYYLTSIVDKILEKEDLEFNVYNIPDEKKYEVMGVNTQDELNHLENIYSDIKHKTKHKNHHK